TRLARREPAAVRLEVTPLAYPSHPRRGAPDPRSRSRERLARAMQGRDPEAEIAVGDVLPSGTADHPRERALIGPRRDRLVEVVVRLRVRADEARDARKDPAVVEAVESGERG